MNRVVPQSFTRYRSAAWILLSAAVLLALAFATALAYVGYLFVQFPDTSVTEIWLASNAPQEEGAVSIYIFTNPMPTLHREAFTSPPSDARHLAEAPTVEAAVIPGASEAYVVTAPNGSGWQLLVQLPDRTVINVSSGVLKPEKSGNPLFTVQV